MSFESLNPSTNVDPHALSDAAAIIAFRSGRPDPRTTAPPIFEITHSHPRTTTNKGSIAEFVGEWTTDKEERFNGRVKASLDDVKSFSRHSQKEWDNIQYAIKLSQFYYSMNPEHRFRRSGEPAYVHPLRVATRYAEWCDEIFGQTANDLFVPQVFTGFVFHDGKENTPLVPRTLKAFGETCCAIVNDLTVKVDRRLGFPRACSELRNVLRSVERESLLGRAIDSLDNAETLLAWTKNPASQELSSVERTLSRLAKDEQWIREKRDTVCVVLDEVLENPRGGRPHSLRPLLARARVELNHALDVAEKELSATRESLS